MQVFSQPGFPTGASQLREPSHLHAPSRGWFLGFPVTTGPRLRTGPQTISTQGDPSASEQIPRAKTAVYLGYLVSSPPLATDHESQLHRLAGDAALQPQAAEGELMDERMGATT